MTTVNPIESAKENYKAALLAQAEPINARIAELKTELATLETQKRTITAQVNLIDKKPGQGRVWTAEAKQKLSIALKAAAARKKAAQGGATTTPAPQGSAAPIIDNKMKAANDDSVATPVSAKKSARK
jgi:hypothetical protein